MTVETAYNFLKPSLETLSQKEREALCKLIAGEVPKKKKKVDPIPTIPEIKRSLLNTVFKH